MSRLDNGFIYIKLITKGAKKHMTFTTYKITRKKWRVKKIRLTEKGEYALAKIVAYLIVLVSILFPILLVGWAETW